MILQGFRKPIIHGDMIGPETSDKKLMEEIKVMIPHMQEGKECRWADFFPSRM